MACRRGTPNLSPGESRYHQFTTAAAAAAPSGGGGTRGAAAAAAAADVAAAAEGMEGLSLQEGDDEQMEL